MSTTIDLADAAVVFLVASGASYLIGTRVGRREKEQSQRERVASRRARRLELKHRAPEPDEEQGPDTTLDEPVEEIASVDVPARQRFTGLVAGSSDPATRRHLDPNWSRSFASIAAALRDDTDPSDAATPLFHETGLALLGPTGHYPVYVAPAPQPQRLVEVDGPDPERIAATRAMHLAATRGGTDDMPVPVDPPVPTSSHPTPDQPASPHTPPPPPVPRSGPRPGGTTDTDGRPSQPKPRTVGAAA